MPEIINALQIPAHHSMLHLTIHIQCLWLMFTDIKYSYQLCRTSIQARLGDDHQMMMFCEHMSQSAPHPVVLALMFCTTERHTYFQSTSITRFECVQSNAAVNGELGSAATCSEHHVSINSHRLCALDPTTSSFHICLHCCYAHLSIVFGLGAYAVVAVHISHKVYLYHPIKQ